MLGHGPAQTDFVPCPLSLPVYYLFIYKPRSLQIQKRRRVIPSPNQHHMLHITSAKRCHCQFPIASSPEGAFPHSRSSHTQKPTTSPAKKSPARHAKLGTANDVQLPLPFSLPRPHFTQRKPYHTNGTRRGSRSDQRGKGTHPVALESPRCAPKGGTTTRLKRGGPSYNLQASSSTLARNVISRLRRRNGRGIRNKSRRQLCKGGTAAGYSQTLWRQGICTGF